jgi:hypothetical protein
MIYTRHKTLTDTTLQTLFTVPNGYHTVIKYIFVANRAGSTNSVDLYWDLNGTPELYVFDGTSIGGGDNITLANADGPMFVLHSGETVKAQAGSSGTLETAVTFELYENPAVLINFV